jgi:hypothetical protein
MKVTDIIKKECKCGKSGSVTLVDNKIVFDSSTDQCHPIEIELDMLEELIKKHKKDVEFKRYLKSIKKYKAENEV